MDQQWILSVRRVDRLEQRLDRRIDELEARLYRRIADVEARITRLDNRVSGLFDDIYSRSASLGTAPDRASEGR
jgi:hypothetical protein